MTDLVIMLFHIVSTLLSLVCAALCVKDKSFMGATGWLTSFMFSVLYYGTIHGLIK